MKAKAFLLSFLLSFIPLCNFAQSSASANNIAIQGIARDNNNTARIDETISITFTLYYKDSNATNVTIGSPDTVDLLTDAFGVFSYILNPGVVNNFKFANNQVYLKIEEGSVVISDEKLNHVPYAIAANNGVPTGSIMPFVGETAPEGWLLCDGLTGVPQPSALYDLIGDTTPDLQGMFLRGTGTNPVNNQPGPELKGIQADGIKDHIHDIDINTDIDNHRHSTNFSNTTADDGIGGTNKTVLQPGSNNPRNTNTDGGHDHNVNGITGFGPDGIEETRPVNYGVNYIIKL